MKQYEEHKDFIETVWGTFGDVYESFHCHGGEGGAINGESSCISKFFQEI